MYLTPFHCWTFGVFPVFHSSADTETNLFKDISLNVLILS